MSDEKNPGLPPEMQGETLGGDQGELSTGGTLLEDRVPGTGPNPSGRLSSGPHPSIPEGQVQKLPGYKLKADVMEFTLDGVTYSNNAGNHKHHAFLTLLQREGKWFRQSVIREMYPADAPYWRNEK